MTKARQVHSISVPPKRESFIATVQRLDFAAIRSIVEGCSSESELMEAGIAFGILTTRGQWGVAETLRKAKMCLPPARYKEFREALALRLGISPETLRVHYERCIEVFDDPNTRDPTLSFFHHVVAALAVNPHDALRKAREFSWSVHTLQQYVNSQREQAKAEAYISPTQVPEGALATPQQVSSEVVEAEYRVQEPPPVSITTAQLLESEARQKEAEKAVRAAQLIDELLRLHNRRWFSVLLSMFDFAKTAEEGEDFVYNCLRLVAEAVDPAVPQIVTDIFWDEETLSFLQKLNESVARTR